MENMEQLSYVEALELERVKMLVFQRELPLSIELVSRAIETYRQHKDLSESWFEETVSHNNDRGGVLEFIPITKNPNITYASLPEEDRPQDFYQQPCPSDQKSDWLRSVQLWNRIPNDLASEPSKTKSYAIRKGFKNTTLEKSAESSSTNPLNDYQLERGEGISKINDHDKEESTKRKQRRCWSQELHRRFLHSVQQLGGAHVATPKQIRELMKVDGLTNDEVKSHLQKYRLHTRRPTLVSPNQDNCSAAQAAHQFVFVGGIWVPPSDHYPTMPSANNTTEVNRVYTSIVPAVVQPHPWKAILNQEPQVIKNENSQGLGDALARCFSSSTSSASTRTTASPVY